VGFSTHMPPARCNRCSTAICPLSKSPDPRATPCLVGAAPQPQAAAPSATPRCAKVAQD
jgi:hypothetical protein